MKKTILLSIIILMSLSVIAQKSIPKPITIADTVLVINGVSTHLIYTWPMGQMETQPADSMKNDTVFIKNYFSLRGSNVLFYLIKKRIIGTDTILTKENIQVPFTSIYTAMSALYGSAIVKKKIKEYLTKSYQKRISDQ
jgi:hypothetical protein